MGGGFACASVFAGPYYRWDADNDTAAPTETGSLRRHIEPVGASGDLAPWLGLLWPFGLSVPSAARQRCNDIGYSFANNSGTKWSWCCVDAYWNEWASYSITPAAKCELEAATFLLHSMCLEMVNEVVADKTDSLMDLFEVPQELRAAVRSSWRNRQQDLLGRFDLLYDGIIFVKIALF